MGKSISVYFEDEVIESVEKKAGEDNRSFSFMINFLLKKILDIKDE